MAGVFDGFATIKRDGVPSFVDDLLGRFKWYDGSNKDYDPSNPFTANFWHKCKWGIILSYCACASFQVWKIHGFWIALVAFIILETIQGTTFRTLYNWILPKQGQGNFWSWVLSFNPFVNWHK
jgi:hypothetical protein